MGAKFSSFFLNYKFLNYLHCVLESTHVLLHQNVQLSKFKLNRYLNIYLYKLQGLKMPFGDRVIIIKYFILLYTNIY